MVAASVWSLLIPAMEMASVHNSQFISHNEAIAWSVLPAAVGFLLGMGFLLLIPEASSGQHSNLSTIGFAIGFVLMMVLDVVMG